MVKHQWAIERVVTRSFLIAIEFWRVEVIHEEVIHEEVIHEEVIHEEVIHEEVIHEALGLRTKTD